jgi:DNA-binding LacI/PurR family transcriptional regulator
LEGAARQLLSLRSRPSAVLCFDLQLMEALFGAAAKEGIRCPEDISVITRSWSSIPGRTPTMFMSDPVLMGNHAARLLAERRSGKRRHAVKLALPSRLVMGTTTGPAPKGPLET